MKEGYFKLITTIERLHRLFLEAFKVELTRLKVLDINNVQCLVLYNIGDSRVTIKDLTNRGYYLGSNVTYNLYKMVQNGYIVQEPSLQDRRSTHVKLSQKGIDLHRKLGNLFTMHVKNLAFEGIGKHEMEELQNAFALLEKFWAKPLTHGLG